MNLILLPLYSHWKSILIEKLKYSFTLFEGEWISIWDKILIQNLLFTDNQLLNSFRIDCSWFNIYLYLMNIKQRFKHTSNEPFTKGCLCEIRMFNWPTINNTTDDNHMIIEEENINHKKRKFSTY